MSEPIVTNDVLTNWLHGQVQQAKLASVLGWTLVGLPPANPYAEIMQSTLRLLGWSDFTRVATHSASRPVYAAAGVALWRAIVRALTTATDYSAYGGTFPRSQLLKNARDVLADMEADASSYGIGLHTMPPVTRGAISYPDDPYRADTNSTRRILRKPRGG